MEIILNIDWTAVVVSAVLAYVLGALWYSERCFGPKWKAGIGTPAVANMPMMPGMLAQAVATFLLAWVVGVILFSGSTAFLVLVTLMVVTLIKANGFFAGKTNYAIFVETSFIIAMVVLMWLVQTVI